MNDYQPTPKLRFVARRAAGRPGQPVGTVRILQQQWMRSDGALEWRDIPLEVEAQKAGHDR